MSIKPKQAPGNDAFFAPGRPQGHGGGNDGGDMLEARVARLESDVSHIRSDIEHIKTDMREMRHDIRDVRQDMQTDFRLLFGCVIAVALGLAGLIAKGFHWL